MTHTTNYSVTVLSALLRVYIMTFLRVFLPFSSIIINSNTMFQSWSTTVMIIPHVYCCEIIGSAMVAIGRE